MDVFYHKKFIFQLFSYQLIQFLNLYNFRKFYKRIKRNIPFAKSKPYFLYDKEIILCLNDNLARDTACIMPLSSVQFFLNNAPFLIVHLVYLTVSHFICLCIIVATMPSHFVCRDVLLRYRREGDRKRTRSGDSELLFFLRIALRPQSQSRRKKQAVT